MSVFGVFFHAGIDWERGFAMLYAMVTNEGDKAYSLTSRHYLVLMLYFFLHWLEYNDYFPKSARVARIREYTWLWLPAGAILLMAYASGFAGGDLPFVYFQF